MVLGRRFAAAVAAAGTVAALAVGCGGGSGGGRTAPPPPDRLTVILESDQGSTFRVALDCGVADRATCSAILEAIAQERDDETCVAVAPIGGRIVVRGLIDGQEVGAAIDRRTDCEARLYDRVRAALDP